MSDIASGSSLSGGAKRTTAVLTLAVIATALVMLALSFGSKLPCLGGPYDDLGSSPDGENQNRLYCYSDLQQLWTGRGIAEGDFPYINGTYQAPTEDGGANVMDGAIEYPVVTGLFMWVSKQPASNVLQYVAWTVLLMAPFAAGTGWMLARMAGRRAFLWAAAPALVVYGAYNWDLLPVFMVVAAVYAWWRGKPTLAAVLLGLGAATKIYPGFFLLPLVIERLVARDVRGAGKVAAAGAGTWFVVNLPFMVINWDGWIATYKFQMARTADISTNSIYLWFNWGKYWGDGDLDKGLVDHLSMGLILASWVLALALGWFFRPSPRAYPWIQVSAAMLCGFLAFNKVYSPQYIMWLLPFFALIRVRWGWWVATTLIDLTLFFGLFRWYEVMSQGGGFSLGEQLSAMGGWSKTVLFTALVFVFPRTRTVLDDVSPPDPGGTDVGEPTALDADGAAREAEGAAPETGGAAPGTDDPARAESEDLANDQPNEIEVRA